MTPVHDCLIVGAGLSGLMAAAVLVGGGATPLMLDKGRSPGGRLATRRIGPGRADHGAQFFTARSPAFAAWVDRWQQAGHVFVWSYGWSEGSLAAAPPDGHARYAASGGMNALAQHLAASVVGSGARLGLNAQIVAVRRVNRVWEAQTASGEVHHGTALLLTIPAPQALALLDAGGVTLESSDRTALERIAYAPCLCGLVRIEGGVTLPGPGALQQPEAAVSWMADNQRKGISPDARLITVHGSPAFSAEHWSQDDSTILRRLQAELEPWLAPDAFIAEAQLKRWRYALPVTLHPNRYLQAAGLSRLFFAGDAFGAPRVEGAALSGMAVGERLLNLLAPIPGSA